MATNHCLFLDQFLALLRQQINQFFQQQVYISRSNREYAIVIGSIIGNKVTEELNEDIKVDLEVRPNIATITLVFYWPITTMDILVFASLIFVYIWHQLEPVCGRRPLLSRVQLLSFVPYAKFVACNVFEITCSIT